MFCSSFDFPFPSQVSPAVESREEIRTKILNQNRVHYKKRRAVISFSEFLSFESEFSRVEENEKFVEKNRRGKKSAKNEEKLRENENQMKNEKIDEIHLEEENISQATPAPFLEQFRSLAEEINSEDFFESEIRKPNREENIEEMKNQKIEQFQIENENQFEFQFEPPVEWKFHSELELIETKFQLNEEENWKIWPTQQWTSEEEMREENNREEENQWNFENYENNYSQNQLRSIDAFLV